MGAVQVVFSSIGTLVVYALIAGGVFKLFQVATDLGEIKDLLKDIKRNSQDFPPPAWRSSTQSPEDLLRAVESESYPSVETQH